MNIHELAMMINLGCYSHPHAAVIMNTWKLLIYHSTQAIHLVSQTEACRLQSSPYGYRFV